MTATRYCGWPRLLIQVALYHFQVALPVVIAIREATDRYRMRFCFQRRVITKCFEGGSRFQLPNAQRACMLATSSPSASRYGASTLKTFWPYILPSQNFHIW